MQDGPEVWLIAASDSGVGVTAADQGGAATITIKYSLKKPIREQKDDRSCKRLRQKRPY